MHRIKKQILQAIIEGSSSVYALVDKQDASLAEFVVEIEKMEQENLIKREGNKVLLTNKGLRLCENQNIKGLGVACKQCGGTGYSVHGFFGNVLQEYRKIASTRPESVEQYDQGFISDEGIIQRVEFIYERGDMVNSEILVVGDDDLLSIAIALTGMVKHVTAVDIDKRIVDYINKIADSYSLPLEAYVYDVQRDFPEDFKSKYQVFVTDPVETIPGLMLFLSRGVSALKGIGCSGYFGLTTLEASREKWYEIQKMILDMNFVITDIKRRFSVYPMEKKSFLRYQHKLPIFKKLGTMDDYDWFRSSFFRIEAVDTPIPLFEGEKVMEEKFYIDEESLATPHKNNFP